MKKTIATAIHLLEEAQDEKDCEKVMARVKQALQILRYLHTGRRKIDPAVVGDVPTQKFFKVLELLQGNKRRKAPVQATTIAILIAKHGGKASLKDLSQETGAYKTHIKRFAKRDGFVYDPATKSLELDPNLYEKIKAILEG